MIKLNFNYNDMNVDSEELLVKNYTEWQRDLFNDLSVKELSNLAMKEYKTSSF